jgi:hypothetical protein
LIKYKNYWRKTGLKKPFGDFVLNHIHQNNVQNFLEVGVFCGVTSRNVCELLNQNTSGNFKYYGIDLFGSEKSGKEDEIEPNFLKGQHFSNPLKNIYYNFIKKENLNSIESVSKFLDKFKQQATLLKGDSRESLSKVPLEQINYVFLDGGHSYGTVISDLTILTKGLKKNSVILCDDYADHFCIPEVKSAIDDFAKQYSVAINTLSGRFAEIILI